jgi:nicotinate-nucleotide pyrophosphorylase (carboxylating)
MTGNNPDIDAVLLQALREDAGSGDITTSSVITGRSTSRAVLTAKEDMVLSGIDCSRRVFELVDGTVTFRAIKKDGMRVSAGRTVAEIRGRTASLLLAERTALNILQRMSGIATLTDRYVQAVRGLKVKITDTRKTAPCLRLFDKYAVKTGGGHNHRFGLSDGVLIKDNHIRAAGGIGAAVRRARSHAHHLLKIEVETSTMAEVRQALKAGAEVIMLDNMTLKGMKKAVTLIRSTAKGVLIEASGTVTLENVRAVAETGVDLISVGALTHSAAAADLSMKLTDF